MTIAFRLFLGLILIAPAFLFADSLFAHGVLTAFVAFLLLIVAISIRPGEAGFFASSIKPYAVIGALFVVIVLLQFVPLPVASWRHPIWIGAETALGRPVWGSITISPGDTLIALVRFLTVCGLFAIATATAIDRRRAELMLFVLLAVSTATALVLIIHNAGGFVFLGELSGTGPRPAIALSCSVGAVLSLAILVYAVERFETRHSRPDYSHAGHVVALGSAAVALVIALATILLFMSEAELLAALMGIGTFLLIIGFRRAGISAKIGLLIPAITLGVPALIAAQSPASSALDFSFRFARETALPLIDTAGRILGDIGWLGSGAGTFRDIVPLYADLSQQTALTSAPTAVAASIVGFGRVLTWIFLAGALLVIIRLVQGALSRGRDSFYTAAAASCLVAAAIESFLDTSLFHSTSLIQLVAVVGLGVAQCASRSAR